MISLDLCVVSRLELVLGLTLRCEQFSSEKMIEIFYNKQIRKKCFEKTFVKHFKIKKIPFEKLKS